MENIFIPLGEAQQSTGPKICLNMIVKNESRVIERLLTSVAPLIDAYCICDTGSTDNTIELIESFMTKRKIPGKIVHEPFRDFGYNRTFAAKAAAEIPGMDYLLLLDADMVLTGDILNSENIKTFKTSLTADCYHICQGTPQYYYKNVRIMRNYRGYTYWGVTHEYINTPAGTVYESIDMGTLFINDIGDGGAKTDKFERDIRLLTKGLEENPGNDRYTFYLANSLRDAGRYHEAIARFRERIKIGGWIEEIWHSHYSIGNCYRSLGEMEKAIGAWIDAFQAHPKRIESLYEIIKHYREHGKNVAAYMFYKTADASRAKWGASNDFLFLQKDVYDYKLDYEMSILGYYANYDGYQMPKLNMKVLCYPHLPGDINKNIMTNYKFYCPRLIERTTTFDQPFLTKATESLGLASDGTFVKSTPSLVLRGNHLIVNVRYVNYRIDDNGNYVNQENIITKNAIATLDISKDRWQIVDEFELAYERCHDGHYVGLEDIRLYIEGDTMFYNANRGLKSGDMTVETGQIALETKSTKNVRWPKGKYSLEKNWVLFGSNRVIYHWNPELTIGTIVRTAHKSEYAEDSLSYFKELKRNPVPPFFNSLRGSTNGVVIKDELWFICHSVSYEDRRYYYHIVVVLDRETLAVRRYTPFFTFEGEKVEYTLGFVYLEKTDILLIGYSLYDKCAKYMSVSREYFEGEMISFHQ
jgi:glycosyltransferase involved in cell wall biosynthesis